MRIPGNRPGSCTVDRTNQAPKLFFGKLYTFLNLKWVYLAALFIFELGSFICGIAPNSTALIIGRAVAGLGAAGIFTGAILIVANTVPLKKRPVYTGAIGAMYGIASVAGEYNWSSQVVYYTDDF